MNPDRPVDLGLYLVADPECLGGRPLAEVAAAAVRGGVGIVQLRMKTASTREFVREARALKDALVGLGAALIINDRVDVALVCGADGVHLGQSDMPCGEARRLLGKRALIGLSIENSAQAEGSELLDVTYIAASPVFSTPTKVDTAPALGLEGLENMRRLTRRRIVAIGGINETNARQVLEAGADGIAVVSAICGAPDPEAAARRLRVIVDGVAETRSRERG